MDGRLCPFTLFSRLERLTPLTSTVLRKGEGEERMILPNLSNDILDGEENVGMPKRSSGRKQTNFGP